LTFAHFVLAQLPLPPLRVLEVGCGNKGGVVPDLADAGHDVLGIDPHAPEGPLYRRIALEELDDVGAFDAVVAGRVLHHVDPLGTALDKLAALAPLLVVDEFAWNHIDEPTAAWYESRHRELVAAGRDPTGPGSLAGWRLAHRDLHPYERLRGELDARFTERYFEWRPYFYGWLDGPGSERMEEELITAGAIRPIGFRYVGMSRSQREG
jgi:hypothetical protein